MKQFVYFLLAIFIWTSCKADDKKQDSAKAAASVINSDSVNMAHTIHSFYVWYGTTGDQLSTQINFVDAKGNYAKLDEPKFQQYLTELYKTGLVSTDLVEDESKFYHACAEQWKTQKKEGGLAGFDIDRYYCQNDADVAEFQTASVLSRIHGDRAKVKLMLSEKGPNHGPREYEMKLENGKWLLSKLRCNSGVTY